MDIIRKVIIEKYLKIKLAKIHHLSLKRMNWIAYQEEPEKIKTICEAYTLKELLYKIVYELN